MTKKFLFGMMSLATLAACTSDEIESVSVAESKGNVQFVVMNNDAATRASMDGNNIIWSAKDGDLFTLYHGAALNGVTGFQNATYKAEMGKDEACATLKTPSMILPDQAIMVYPADLLFNVKSCDNLSIQIPVELEDVAKSIPYVSDGIKIDNYASASSKDKNTSGYNKEYPIYMRPMASQLTLKTDYNKTTDAIEALYEGESGVEAGEGIDSIKVTSISVKSGSGTEFTKKIELNLPAGTNPNWFDGSSRKDGNSWNAKTTFSTIPTDGKTSVLKSKSLNGNNGCKLLFLKQADITVTATTGVVDGAVIVETQYGKVVVEKEASPGTAGPNGGVYTDAEIKDAWYRYISKTTTAATGETKATTAEADGTYKATSLPVVGMANTINTFSNYTIQKTTSTVYGEEAGTATTRYVKVLLSHLDMSELHIKSDKQLRDVARVWKAKNLPGVKVYLDGEIVSNVNTKVFTMSQKTVDVINQVNAGKTSANQFKVMPCTTYGEECETIKLVQTTPKGAAAINPEKINEHSLLFVVNNGGKKVKNLILANEATPWVWKDQWLISEDIEKITNKGTLINASATTIGAYTQLGVHDIRNTNIYLVNDNKWNVTAGTLRSQISVVNNGELTIAQGAEFLEDSYNQNVNLKVFINNSTTKPQRFNSPAYEEVGTVRNDGVFATIGKGEINNYGLIRHGMAVNDDSETTKNAKTYITRNESKSGQDSWYFGSLVPAQALANADFGTAYTAGNNMMGTIELPYSNKDEDNISISADPEPANAGGFVMVTTKDEISIDMESAGDYVNYLNVKGAATNLQINTGSIDYIEFNTTGTEVVFQPSKYTPYNFDGMMVLSNINIKLGTTVWSSVTYLSGKMYVGGKFNDDTTNWKGYYGNTTGKVPTNYITF